MGDPTRQNNLRTCPNYFDYNVDKNVLSGIEYKDIRAHEYEIFHIKFY